MVEALFLLGMLGWLVVTCWEWLAAQPAFATFCAGFFFVPVAYVTERARLAFAHDLLPLDTRRERTPLPPEIFYWELRRGALLRQNLLLGALSAIAWVAAAVYPAGFALTSVPVLGWIFGASAILGTARVFAGTSVYFHASQWFDPMRPAIIGCYRKMMFWLSEDAGFLGRLRQPTAQREKAVY